MAHHQKHKKTSGTWEIERLDPKHTPFFAKKLIREHLERYILAAKFCHSKTVVDLGCGSGYGSSILAESKPIKVLAIDIDKNAIEYAKKNYSHPLIEFKQASADKTNLPNESVDVLISFETIEHVPDATKMLDEIQRVLKPDGIAIISTPNKETSFSDNPYHLKEYTLTELDKLLSGFSSKRYYGQRKVNRQLIKLYKQIHKLLPSTFLRMFLKFRPWESPKISPLKHKTRQPYLYLIAVCQKKKSR